MTGANTRKAWTDENDKGYVTSINLPVSLALIARVEASKLNLSRSAFIRQILIKELEKLKADNARY